MEVKVGEKGIGEGVRSKKKSPREEMQEEVKKGNSGE